MFYLFGIILSFFCIFNLMITLYSIRTQGTIQPFRNTNFFVILSNKLLKEENLTESFFFCSLATSSIFLTSLGINTFFFLGDLSSKYQIVFPTTPFLIIFLASISIICVCLPKKILLRKNTTGFVQIAKIISSGILLITFPLFAVFLRKLFKINEEITGKTQTIYNIETIKEKIVQSLSSQETKKNMTSFHVNLTEAVLNFKDIIVREAMIPRVDLFCLSESSSIKTAAQTLIKEGYSRVPIYKNSIDNITGVLMFKDILKIYMECEEKKIPEEHLILPISSIAKPALYTPETKKISELLQEFRLKRTHMAIVVDEYGGTEGIVTLEDLLEEIVGEISDEYDLNPDVLYKKEGDSWIVDGRMSISELEKTFNISIDQENTYDTLAGHVFHKVGAVPQKGLKIHHEDFDLEILSCSERSIKKLKLTTLKKKSK